VESKCATAKQHSGKPQSRLCHTHSTPAHTQRRFERAEKGKRCTHGPALRASVAADDDELPRANLQEGGVRRRRAMKAYYD
jgi:hypothetical protein